MDRNISDRAADPDPARLEPGRHILHIRSMLHPVHADHVESNTGNRRQNPRRNRNLLDLQEIMHAKNKIPLRKLPRGIRCAPDGNRTTCDYQ